MRSRFYTNIRTSLLPETTKGLGNINIFPNLGLFDFYDDIEISEIMLLFLLLIADPAVVGGKLEIRSIQNPTMKVMPIVCVEQILKNICPKQYLK